MYELPEDFLSKGKNAKGIHTDRQSGYMCCILQPKKIFTKKNHFKGSFLTLVEHLFSNGSAYF